MEINDKYFLEKIWPNVDDVPINTNPVFIKFYGEHCQPCKMMEPIVKQLEQEYPQIIFYSINASSNPLLCEALNIVSVPIFMLINKNHTIYTLCGAMPKIKLKNAIEEYLL